MSDPLARELVAIGDRLQNAVQARDWGRAAQADRELRALAHIVAAQSRWCEARLEALKRSGQLFEKSLELIRMERQRLALEMEAIIKSERAWRAYGHLQALENCE